MFHSFIYFDVGTGHIVHFESEAGVNNIISRITGDRPSSIDGALGADANLFFLNPNGVMFGPNARLNINGSFYVSTADKLSFADGAMLTADLGVDSQFSIADPKSFGFTRNAPGNIEIRNSILNIQNGDLALIGGDIEITGGILDASNGQLQLASAASPNEVFIDVDQPLNFDVGNSEALGEINVLSFALLQGNHLGTRSGSLTVNSGLLWAHESIDIDVEGNMVVSGTSNIGRNPFRQEENTRGVNIQASTLLVEDSLINWTADNSRAATITVDVNQLMLVNGGRLSASAAIDTSGGAVRVKATDSVTISGPWKRYFQYIRRQC